MTTRRVGGADRLGRPSRDPGPPGDEPAYRNEVCLVGRVSGDPEQRVLPSGDTIVTFRVVVPRDDNTSARAVEGRRPQSVDTIDCVAWTARTRRTSATWCSGDVVEVTGALRRRFYRAGATTLSRVEVEVTRGRRRRRARG